MTLMRNAAFGAVASLLLFGCSSQGTIAGLEQDQIEVEQSTLDFSNLDHEKVRNEYQDLLDLVDDDYLKEKIQRRIAGVRMQEGDENTATKAPKQGYYRNAIADHLDILEKYPNSPDNAEVLYQLAKAYDIEGKTNNARQMLERLVRRHPNYPAISEAYFRLGDIYFSKNWYKKSENAYRATTEKNSGKLVLNAHYMLAWALYKQGDYNQSLNNLAIVINRLLASVTTNKNLSKAQQNLVEDALHSMSLALVSLGGAKAIEDVKMLKDKEYIWRIYDELAKFYLEKARYDDSAVTYREYILSNPLDKRSSDFHSKLIAAYVNGAFPKLVLSEKENYVEFYGPTSKYIKAYPDQKQTLYKNLNQYYSELAQHYHAEGQQAVKQYEKSKEPHLKSLAVTSLTKATSYYGQFIATFPEDLIAASLMYKKADAHFENNQYSLAASDYSVIAYGNDQFKKASYIQGNKAAYASLISFNEYIKQLKYNQTDKKEIQIWQAKSVDAMLMFAEVFHKDQRAVAVLTNAAQELFALNEFDRAISVAANLIKKTPRLEKDLKQTAYGIIAHSYFQKGEYQLAQKNYQAQRKLVKKSSADYSDISNQVAASIYKNSEAIQLTAAEKVKSGKAKKELLAASNALAIKKLLSLKVLAPRTNIRIIGQYDAASLMLKDKQWKSAITELSELQSKFSKHKLAIEFPRKLAFAYEQDKQWNKAEVVYTALFNLDPDPKVRQDALFVSAGLQQKLGRNKKAIEYYRDYAHKYEKPFDNRMEARFHLAGLYLKEKDNDRHLFWLRRIIDGDQRGGDKRTERSRYLGAWANVKYGDYFAWEFSLRKLRLPLDSSMQRKNKYIQDATTRYNMASEYGILEFVTQATFKMGALYSKFGSELKSAPVPKEMIADDIIVYKKIMVQQGQPFLDLAADIHINNLQLSWKGYFNKWISQSFDAMQGLSPARFGKVEKVARYGDEIR
jgi:tetratricopeptide (TPR) repeat protein